MSSQSIAQDTDSDGIGDYVEKLIHLNPSVVDSDGDGIDDANEYFEFKSSGTQTARSLLSSNFLIDPTIDTDEDGIPDFTEFYGYYNDGNLLRNSKRSMDDPTWLDMRNNENHNVTIDNIEFKTARWAIRALEGAGKATATTIIDPFTNEEKAVQVVNVDGIYDLVYAFVIEKMENLGVNNPEFHIVITGSQTENGTIASVLAAIMILSESYEPSQEVFFTNPSRFSTDFDPYSDKDEALGVFVGSAPRTGAHHPLIGAMPQLITSIDGITLYDMTTIEDSTGEEFGEEISTSLTLENSQTNESFWSVGRTVSTEFEFGSGFSSGVELTRESGESTSFTSSSAIETGSSTFNSISRGTSSAVSNSCFSSMALNLNVKNVGSDEASLIIPFWDVYFGDSLWGTLEYEDVGMNLAAGQSDIRTILGRSEGSSCLSVEETDYIANGGAIGLSTGISSARLTLLNDATGQVDNNSDWSALLNAFSSDLSRVIIKGKSDSGNDYTRNFWLVGYDQAPEKRNTVLSIKEALDIAYESFDCQSNDYPSAALCYKTDLGDFVIGAGESAASTFEFTFYDSDFNKIEDPEFIDSLESKNNSAHYWDKLLPAKTTVTINSQVSLKPTIGEAEVFQRYNTDGTLSTGADIHAIVNDHFGIVKVEVCDGLACQEINERSETGNRNNIYSISEFVTENATSLTLRAENVLGNVTEVPISKLSPMFSAFTTDMLEFIDEYVAAIDIYLDKLESLPADKYLYYQRLGIIEDIDNTRSYENRLTLDSADLLTACNNVETVANCFRLLENFENEYLLHSPKVFDIDQLPIRNVLYMLEDGASVPEGEASCPIPNHSILVGIGIKADIPNDYFNADAKVNLSSRKITPTFTPKPPYFTFGDRVSHCDSGFSSEAKFYELDFEDNTGTKVYGITNFGWDVDGGEVNRLCVGRHAVDLNKEGPLATVDEYDSNCGPTNTWSGIEERTSSIPTKENGLPRHLAASTKFIKATEAKFTRYDEAEIVFANAYESGLVNGAKYRIKNVSSGNYLQKRSGENSIVDTSILDENEIGQVWTIDAINSREYRIRSASNGSYLTVPEITNSDIFSQAVSSADNIQAPDYRQHFRLPRRGKPHRIKSVFRKDKYLSSDKKFTSDFTDNEVYWIFERVSEKDHDHVSVITKNTDIELVNHDSREINFGNQFDYPPTVFAQMQSTNGLDTAALRIDHVGEGSFRVKVEEEKSQDNELAHSNEEVGFLALEWGHLVDEENKIIGEMGVIHDVVQNSLSEIHNFSFERVYNDPIVILMMNSANGSDPAHIRVHSVNESGVTYQIEEWRYQNGIRSSSDDVAYWVLEKGTHTLASGERLQAFTTQLNDTATSVNFVQSFSGPPIVLSQSQTVNGADPIVTRQSAITPSSVEMFLQEEQAGDGHSMETVAVIAVGSP